jgi:hypothetical protein
VRVLSSCWKVYAMAVPLPFEGFARIRFENLDFRHRWNKFSNVVPNSKQVAKLVSVFKAERCRNTFVENIINAIVVLEPGESLPNLKRIAESKHKFLNKTAYCLDGLHRITAGGEFLLAGDQWWTVRVYDAACISNGHVTEILERYSHEQAFSDGTIFRKIMQYHLSDPRSEAKWWARLSSTKRTDLRQLLKHTPLEMAFGDCISYESLWAPIQLGALHRLNPLKCYEVRDLSTLFCREKLVLTLAGNHNVYPSRTRFLD